MIGAGRAAVRDDDTFPFEMMYTLQKSGAPLYTAVGTSNPLNLLFMFMLILFGRSNIYLNWPFRFIYKC